MIRIALFQPEIPQNTGTLLRLGACMGVPVHIIEPTGFIISDKRMRRSGMDYLDSACMHRHENWESFNQETASDRLVYLTPSTDTSFLDFQFKSGDILLLGSESSGIPEEIANTIPHQVKIPMLQGRRSLNIAIACSMVLGEALRQTGSYPKI